MTALSRAEADRLLSAAIEEAQRINADASLCYKVALEVFGSYLSDKQLIGDLDLALTLSPRPGVPLPPAKSAGLGGPALQALARLQAIDPRLHVSLSTTTLGSGWKRRPLRLEGGAL